MTYFVVWISFAFIVGINVGFVLSQVWERRRTSKLERMMAIADQRLAVIVRRLGPWIQRQPTEKAPPTSETFSESEIPTKK